MTTVLVVGGYGAVGSELCRILSRDRDIDLVVAGRDGEKASRLATELGARSRVVDVTDPDACASGLEDTDVVVNCFVDVVEPSLDLPEAAIARGIYYLDPAAVPVEYLERLLALSERAHAGGATLVTALGVNPGMPALLAIHAGKVFDQVDSVDVYFTMGSKLGGLSPLSLRGVGLMMKTWPLQWRDGDWRKPSLSGKKRFVGAPFERQVYFGSAMITPDLLDVPRLIRSKDFAFFSGMEQTLQGIVLLLGIKLGATKTHRRAERFLRVLRWLGRGDDATNDIGLEVVVVGEKDGRRQRRVVSMHCGEEYATAVALAILCRQIAHGQVTARGAFVPQQVAAIGDFVEQLRDADVHLAEKVETIENGTGDSQEPAS